MANFVRLDALRDGVADKADIIISASGVRHTTVKVNSRINRSLRKWLSIMFNCGDRTYLVREEAQTSASSADDGDGWPTNSYVLLSSTVERIFQVDMIDGDEVITMYPWTESKRNDFESASALSVGVNSGLGRPVAYMLGPSSAGGSRLLIFPRADAVYTVRAAYQGSHTLSSDGDTFEFTGDAAEWVMNDAAMQCLQNDGLAGRPQYIELIRQNAAIEAQAKLDAATRWGPTHRVDTKGRRNWAITRAWTRYP